MKLWKSGILLFLALALAALAQEFRGRVQGVVTDKSDARVAGARLTLVNVATGVALKSESSASGTYMFDFVAPGNYTLIAEQQGFSKAVQENVAVPVGGDVTVNLALAVGAMTEAITVKETPPDLKFNSASIDTVITKEMVTALPQAARNPFALAMLEPSVRFNGSGGGMEPFMVWGGSGVAVGGTNQREGELLVDGAPTKVSTMTGYAPNMDAVQEFAVLQNSTDAEQGFSSGGVITLVTKSGTNEWHGTAAYVGRNPVLNGKSFKYNLASTERRNIETFSVGNPIKKNKLFTFNSFENWKWIPGGSGLTSTQPTDAERTGDFSQSLTAAGGLRMIYDPATTVLDTATNTATRQPFPGNKIPSNLINPASASLMTYFWRPNRAPDDLTGRNNFNTREFRVEKYWNFLHKTDWNISDKLRVYGRFAKSSNNTSMNGAGTIAENNSWDGRSSQNMSLTGDAVYTLNSRALLDIRASYAELNQLYPTESITFPYNEWKDKFFGGSDWGKSYYDGAIGLRFPRISVGGRQTYGANLGWMQYGKNLVVQPKVAMAVGRHYLKVGADYRHQRLTAGWPAGPSFNFNQDATASTFINPNLATSGDGYASFLLGGISSGNAPYLPDLKPRDTFLGLFFQDDLKLNSRVTLNLGLRLDRDPGPWEEKNRVLRYADPNGSLPALAAANIQMPDAVNQIRTQYGLGAPSWTGGAYYADASHRRIYDSPMQLQPRVGAAVKLDDRTSLRLAYARWAVPPILTLGGLQMPTGISWGGGGMTGYGYFVQTNVQGFQQGKPLASMNNPFPNGLLPPTGNSLGVYTQVGSSITWNRQAYRPPVSDRFNISLQRQLPGRIVVDATYLFHYGNNVQPASVDDGQTYLTDYNIVDPRIRSSLRSQLDQSVPNPFYLALPSNQFPGDLRTLKTVSVGQLIKPYPYYTGFSERNRPGLHNKYNSIQLKAVREMANGLHFMASYAHDVDKYQQFTGNTLQEFLNQPDYLSRSDPRHRVNVVTVAELPFGHGRKFFGNTNRIADLIVGGWNFSAIYTWRSGSLLTLGDWSMTGLPVTVPEPNGTQWLNAKAFARKGDPYALRTSPVYVDGLVGPRYWNIDATLAKQFRIKERMNLELRVEAYNATNTWLQPGPNMSGPDDPNFGKILATADPATGARYCQYQLRLNF